MKNSIKQAIQHSLQSPWISGQCLIWCTLGCSAFIAALLLRFTSFNESHLPITVYIISALTLFSGGYIAGKTTKRKGWFYGGSQGIIYASVLFLISFLAFDSGLQINPFLLFIWAFGISGLGGVFGVNAHQ